MDKEIINKPVRIAHVIGKLMAGGVESVVFNYYRAIDKTKVQFDFFYDEDSTVEPPCDLVGMGARFYKIPPYQKLFSYLNKLEELFTNNNYRIIHSHLNTLNVFPLYVAWKCNIPHRIAHNHSVPGKGETKKNILKHLLRPFSKVFPNHLFACSSYAGDWIYGNKSNYKVINNAIDLKKFLFNYEIRKRVRNELRIPDDVKVIGHIGRFCYQKNHDFLIDIFYEVLKKENVVLMLIGQGELESNIKEKVLTLNIKDKVFFLGKRNDTFNYYNAMDLFVLPSRYEGLPVVGVEAQANGLPCVFSNNVTDETKILDSTVFVKDKLEDYVEAIINNFGIERKNTEDVVKLAGFDIKTESKKLLDIYTSFIKTI